MPLNVYKFSRKKLVSGSAGSYVLPLSKSVKYMPNWRGKNFNKINKFMIVSTKVNLVNLQAPPYSFLNAPTSVF
jgi:hypothetical protein